VTDPRTTAEGLRLEEDERRDRNWTRWGPYLAARQWGTVREDYSPGGTSWASLPHDHARSRAYRWGEDGLLGLTDRECRVCFAVALWNGKDPILKERPFGLSGPEGNHGEDVKELYYFLDATPTASYLKALYKYPQDAYPYARLVDENRRRGRGEPEYELEDTGVFDGGRYFDVLVEYAKADPDDVLVRITCANRGPAPATLHLLPTIWLRNTWAWGRTGEGYWPKGRIARADGGVLVEHPSLGRWRLACEVAGGAAPRVVFTDNETDYQRLFAVPNRTPYVKDAFHRLVVDGEEAAVNPAGEGTKAAAWYVLTVPAGGERTVRLRLTADAAAPREPFGPGFEDVVRRRIAEADAFHLAQRSAPLTPEERRVVRQADAGLVWSRQYYGYVVDQWLEGDPAQPPPPASRRAGPNRGWTHFYARDVLSVPDTWEYPWFAAWDLAFQAVAAARVDPGFAKRQLLLLCREWYQHPNGQLPAYEFAFADVNPPVHAWGAWRVYQLEKAARGGAGDRAFLESVFQKCLVNFTWWVNREDLAGDNLFTGGFLGLDNVGFFDRSRPLPGGGVLEQADATAWMAFYSTTMLAISLELAREDRAYADVASMFFEHFLAIARAMNELGGTGLWDEGDGFYYDQARLEGRSTPLRVRSIVGVIPLFAAETLDAAQLASLPLFRSRLQWVLANRPELTRTIACMHPDALDAHRLLAVATRERLVRVLRYVLDEGELLSPFGVRSLSKIHLEHPATVSLGGQELQVRYAPGESDSGVFGGNSNWRGPVWMPPNYLLIEALKRFHHFYGETLRVECPTGSGRWATLREVAEELERRLARLFLPDGAGRRPLHGGRTRYASDPHFKDLVLFYEYFHGDDGRGLGASHQTGWTALGANVLERVALSRGPR
jgi:hypothetical protein